MDSVVELINLIKQRSPMYIGRKSISCLKAFIDGWCFRNPEGIIDIYIMDRFQDWIQDKYQIKSTQSWCSIILFYSQDESTALEKFFIEFEAFNNESIVGQNL